MNAYNNMFDFVIIFLLSILASVLINILSRNLNNFGLDHDIGIQKIHKIKSTRLGGISIFVTFIVSLNLFDISLTFGWLCIFCLFPALAIGFLEDITQKVSITSRLLGLILSSALLVYFTGTVVENVDIIWFDNFLSYFYFSIIFTVIGFIATANAWNFIDGINGLSSGLAVVITLAFAYLSFQIDLLELYYLNIYLSASISGFWIVNIITGKIFLGDSGSYTLGIFIAWTGVYLSTNNQVSAWLIFFIILYPATELIFSCIRRIINKKSPFMPDDMHLHSIFLVFLRK